MLKFDARISVDIVCSYIDLVLYCDCECLPSTSAHTL